MTSLVLRSRWRQRPVSNQDLKINPAGRRYDEPAGSLFEITQIDVLYETAAVSLRPCVFFDGNMGEKYESVAQYGSRLPPEYRR